MKKFEAIFQHRLLRMVHSYLDKETEVDVSQEIPNELVAANDFKASKSDHEQAIKWFIQSCIAGLEQEEETRETMQQVSESVGD